MDEIVFILYVILKGPLPKNRTGVFFLKRAFWPKSTINSFKPLISLDCIFSNEYG